MEFCDENVWLRMMYEMMSVFKKIYKNHFEKLVAVFKTYQVTHV